MTLHDKINARGLIADFAKNGRKDFVKRFKKLKIGNTYDFERTFEIAGKAPGNNLVIEIFYNFYADFTHAGVGNGVIKEDTSIQKLIGGGRKAKRWKKGIGHTRHRLGEIYAKKAADGMVQTIDDSLQKKVVFRM